MKTKTGVFFGGRSVEHEISVISALQACAALDPLRYEVIPVYITKQGRWLTGDVLLDSANYRDMAALEKRATAVYMKPVFGDRRLYRRGGVRERAVAELDIALPVLHGTNGEDGAFQGLLELVGIPYAGCGVLSSALGMDKIAMKMVLRESGLPTIDYVWFTDRQWAAQHEELTSRIEREIGYPVIVKPANLGSSVGISPARDRGQLLRAVDTANRYSSRILVERMIEPLREINCSVCGSADDHTTSVCEEPLRGDTGGILSYADKYLSGSSTKGGAKGGMSGTRRQIPADLPPETAEEIRRLASETFRVLGCEGVARIDFILDANGTAWVNEINTIPGSLSFYLWEATGLEFGALMDRLVAQALKRDRDHSRKIVSYETNIFNMGPAGGASGMKGIKGGGVKGA